jgi:hypothetical protein
MMNLEARTESDAKKAEQADSGFFIAYRLNPNETNPRFIGISDEQFKKAEAKMREICNPEIFDGERIYTLKKATVRVSNTQPYPLLCICGKERDIIKKTAKTLGLSFDIEKVREESD